MAPAFFVALDFGTANSGFAFTTLNIGERPLLHYEYPDMPHAYPKTRTALLYRKVPLSAYGAPTAWGWTAFTRYSALPPAERGDYEYVEDFKLALAPPGGSYHYTLPEGLSTEKLVSDFLRELASYAVTVIARRYPTFSRGLTRWALTVPAEWGDRSKSTMRTAAALAAIVDDECSPLLTLVFEPEAAAVCVRSHDAAAMPLSEVDTFMIVDAGGGTTDITLHHALRRGGETVLSEAAHRGGVPIGSKLLDRAFESHVRSRIGTQLYDRWAAQPKNAKERSRFLHSDWEQVKLCFDGGVTDGGEPDSKVLVALPNSLRRMLPPPVLEWIREETDGEDSYFPLDTASLRGIFDDAITPIIALAREVVQRWQQSVPAAAAAGQLPTYVALVGGLGSNPYLVSRLRGARLGVSLLAPAYGYSAILEGAVMCAQRSSVISARRSVATYGLQIDREATPASRPQGQYMHAFKQVMWSRECFRTFVRKNDLVPVDSLVTITLGMNHDRNVINTFVIYATSAADAAYTDEPGMVRVGVVTVRVPNAATIPQPSLYCFSVGFKFGAAEIEVSATDIQTGIAAHTTVAFAHA